MSTTTTQAQTANFSLRVAFPSDVLYYDTIVQSMKQQLGTLLINIDDVGSTRPLYNNDLDKKNYDMAILNLDLPFEAYPPLWGQLANDSYTGAQFYNMNSSSLIDAAGISNPSQLFDKLYAYRGAANLTAKVDLAKQIQQIYNSKWLFDIPLVSTSKIIAAWSALDGFDQQEGLVNSLMLGANWTSNPSTRSHSIHEVHYSILNFAEIRNPLYYLDRPGYLSLQPLYSSAFLADKDGNLHPNLVKQYRKVSYTNGSSTWYLHLRNDTTWSDGQPLDARDLQFTYDLASFDWIGSTNQNKWTSLERTTYLNSTTLRLDFSDDKLTTKYALATQYIIPEHVLNKTITVDGQSRHPYEGYNPSSSSLWVQFEGNPVTAGPYNYDNSASKDGVEVFRKNPDYWNPSISDSPGGIFNLDSTTPQTPYYFANTDQVAIDTLVYHVGGAQNVDPNTQYRAFTTGDRDIVEFRTIDPSSELLSAPQYNTEPVYSSGGGLVLVFNIKNPHLQFYDIRQAITMALDRSIFADVAGPGHPMQGTPVSKTYPLFYDQSAEIAYDVDAARTIFKTYGYDVLENTNIQQEWPWERLPLPVLPMLIGLSAIAVIVRFRRRS